MISNWLIDCTGDVCLTKVACVDISSETPRLLISRRCSDTRRQCRQQMRKDWASSLIIASCIVVENIGRSHGGVMTQADHTLSSLSFSLSILSIPVFRSYKTHNLRKNNVASKERKSFNMRWKILHVLLDPPPLNRCRYSVTRRQPALCMGQDTYLIGHCWDKQMCIIGLSLGTLWTIRFHTPALRGRPPPSSRQSYVPPLFRGGVAAGLSGSFGVRFRAPPVQGLILEPKSLRLTVKGLKSP